MAPYFNHDISCWNTSQVTDMGSMFEEAFSFNQPIGAWDVSRVTDMSRLFADARKFNQPLDGWDLSSAKDINSMFWNAHSFNRPLNNWNVSNVNEMQCMFANAKKFNQPLEKWDVSNVTNMNGMFACIGDCFPDGGQAAFSQPITGWRLRGQSTINMFSYSRSSHLETLIMAAASCGPGLTAARRRAYMECDLKAMVCRFGMQDVYDALSRYSDKYTTGPLFKVLEEMKS